MATSMVSPRRANDVADYGGSVAQETMDPRIQQLLEQGYSLEQAQATVAQEDSAPPSTAPTSDVSAYPAAESNTGGRAFDDYAPWPTNTGNGFPMSEVNSSEPGKMSEQDRKIAYTMGSEIDSDIQDRGRGQAADEEYFKRKALEAYGDLAETPGYTEEEAADIARKKEWEALNWNPADEERLQLTDEEKQGVMGNPRAGFDYFDPGYTQEIADSTSANVRGAFNSGTDAINETLENGNNLQQGAIDEGALKFDPNTGQAIDTQIAEGSKRMRDAADYSKLALDPNFKAKYEMSDAERSGIVGKAQRQVGTQYRALQDDVELNAAQSGNASPAAIAAMKSRLARNSAVDMADARANAEIGASAAQRATFKTAEDMRLGAEQNYAALAAQIESDLIAKGVDATLAKEQARLQAQQYLTSVKAETARNIAQQNLDTKTGQQKLQIDMETGLGAQQQAANQANQNMGTQLAVNADQAASDRTKGIAGNRQDVSTYALNSQFQRGQAVNQGVSQGAQTVANARREGQQEVRGFMTGQQAQASDNVNTANDQRIKNFGTMTGAANTATGNKQQYELGKSGQGFTSAFKRSAGNALGKFVVNGVTGAAGGGN